MGRTNNGSFIIANGVDIPQMQSILEYAKQMPIAHIYNKQGTHEIKTFKVYYYPEHPSEYYEMDIKITYKNYKAVFTVIN